MEIDSKVDNLFAIVKDNDERIDELQVKFDHLLEQHKLLWEMVKILKGEG